MLLAAQIALAIHAINPKLPDKTASDYTHVVLYESERHALDPWLLVELVHRETHWIPTLVRHERDGSCSVGLGQINVRCGMQDVAPLLDPHANLRRTATVLDELRSKCTERCGDTAWLRAYNQGSKTYAPAILAAVKKRHAHRG